MLFRSKEKCALNVRLDITVTMLMKHAIDVSLDSQGKLEMINLDVNFVLRELFPTLQICLGVNHAHQVQSLTFREVRVASSARHTKSLLMVLTAVHVPLGRLQIKMELNVSTVHWVRLKTRQ